MPTKTEPKTLAELRPLILQDLAGRTQRQTVRKAERVLDDLEHTLEIRKLSALEDLATYRRFVKAVKPRCKKPGCLRTWEKAYRALVNRADELSWLTRPHWPPMVPEDRGRSCPSAPPADAVALLRRLRPLRHTLIGGRDYLIADLAIFNGVLPMRSLELRLIDIAADFASLELHRRSHGFSATVILRPHQQAFLREWVRQPRVQEEGVLFPGIQRGRWSYHSWLADRPSTRLKNHWAELRVGPHKFSELIRLFQRDQGRGMVELEPEILAGAAPKPAIVIAGPNDPVWVFGRRFEPLGDQQYKFLKRIHEQGVNGRVPTSGFKGLVHYPGERFADLVKKGDEFKRLLRAKAAYAYSEAEYFFGEWSFHD
jgi:hypothetical protein